jgi:hypothetical protein
MNEREEFLQSFRSVFIRIVERLDAMTESEVLSGISEVKAARTIWEKELAERIGALTQADPAQRPRAAFPTREIGNNLAYLVSVHAFVNSVNRLKSRAGAKVRSGHRASPFTSLEDALNERLESLRKRPSDDAFDELT